ncbi:MAG: DUF6110 family protein [Clostridiales bacterium]|nr:DUF6110 family protein [Clostridiales bacterium]
MIGMAKLGVFLGGVLFGTAGVKILSSKDAKKVYTHVTAAALRAKESVMTAVDTLKENCGDILADARDINEARAERETVEDCVETCDKAAGTADSRSNASEEKAER